MTPAAVQRSVEAWQRMLPLSWCGVPCQQFPSDMLAYAQVMFQLRPPWVLEVGTADGGTALFLADMLSALGGGPVITIDTDPRPVKVASPPFVPLKGDAKDPAVVERVAALTGGRLGLRGLVLLDGDHTAAQVLAELEAYAPMADYLIVQDTLMGYLPQYADGPHLALAEWLPAHPEWVVDTGREPVPTNHPGGWLRRT